MVPPVTTSQLDYLSDKTRPESLLTWAWAFFSFWHSLLIKTVFLDCTLTAYHVAAMLSKPVSSKRAAEREGATLIIYLPSN